MPKSSGLGDNLYCDGFDLSGDVGAIGSIGGGNTPLEVTAIDKSAMERLGGKRDGALEYTAFFNPDSARAHVVLSPLPTADRVVSYFRGTALGGPAASMVAKQIGYDPTRNEDGSLTFKVQAQANGFGLEWGRTLSSGGDSLSGAGPGPAVDFLAASSFGLQAYLHVFTFIGTSATMAVQDSADGSTGWANVAAFTVVTAPGAQRAASGGAATVRQFLRVNATGTFSSLDYAVVVAKNDVAVTF